MGKTAIIILSDPKMGSDEATSRVLNGLAAAYDFKQAGEEVKILFQGTATRWPKALQDESHLGHKIYTEVKDKIEGVSAACAAVWGADPAGHDLITGNQLPGTPGLPSIVKMQKEGFNVLIF